MREEQGKKYQIPMVLVVLAYFTCWPIGIVLSILRRVPASAGSTDEIPGTRKQTAPQNKEVREEYSRAYEKQQSKRKTSPATKWMTAGAAAALAALLAVVGYGLNGFLMQGSFLPLLGAGLPLLFVGGGCALGAGLSRKKDIRLNRIRTMIGNRESMHLQKLADASDEDLKTIRKDVQTLIDSGEYGDSAYIDLGTCNFMRTSYADPDIPEGEDIPETEEKPATIGEFSSIIRDIRRLNDDIEDQKVSDCIDRIEAHTKNIFDYVTEHPQAMPQIRTFMNYYLPTTLKLLESYRRIEHVGVAGKNMQQSKEKIEQILDLLVVGFEQQVDQLFRNESMDISSDIKVLETMMQKDGLSGKSDFGEPSAGTAGGAAAQCAPDEQE